MGVRQRRAPRGRGKLVGRQGLGGRAARRGVGRGPEWGSQGTEPAPSARAARQRRGGGVWGEGVGGKYTACAARQRRGRLALYPCRTPARTRDTRTHLRSSACPLLCARQVHRQVRKYIRGIAKPGVRLFDMCEDLEARVRTLIEESGLDAGARPLRGRGVGWVGAWAGDWGRGRAVAARGQGAAREQGEARQQSSAYPLDPLPRPPRHRVPHGLQPQPCRGPLDAQRRRQDGAAVRRRHEARLWHPGGC